MNSEYYEQCDGTMLVFIKHNGLTYDYVNGYKGNQYFDVWDKILYLMEEGKYYAVACTVKEVRGKYRAIPFGVAFEIEDEKVAKDFSFDVMRAVTKGQWDGKEALKMLKVDCVKYLNNFTKQKCLEIINL